MWVTDGGTYDLVDDVVVLYCRAWNVAATDDTLWRTQFLSLFGTSNRSLNLMNVAGVRDGARKPDQDHNNGQALQKTPENAVGAWRKAFNLAQKGMSEDRRSCRS